jgi:hypothetical protein
MKTRNHFLFAVALVLLVGLSAATFGQRKLTNQAAPPEPVDPGTSVSAIEVTDGTVGYDQTKQEVMFGYSFLGRTTGAYPGSFTLSMNCTPAVPIPSDKSQLTGGSWTLPVYMSAKEGSSYAGSLFGTVAKGTMVWDKTGTTATIYMVLNVDGGTQAWEGVGGYATFTGTLFVDEKTEKTMLTGNLVFNIISIYQE